MLELKEDAWNGTIDRAADADRGHERALPGCRAIIAREIPAGKGEFRARAAAGAPVGRNPPARRTGRRGHEPCLSDQGMIGNDPSICQRVE